MSTPYPSTTLILAIYDFNPKEMPYQLESQVHYLLHLPPTLKRLAIEFSNDGYLGARGFDGDRKQVQPIVEALRNLGRLSELVLVVYMDYGGRTLAAQGVADVILGWERALQSQRGDGRSMPADKEVLSQEQGRTLTLLAVGNEATVAKFFEEVDELYRKGDDTPTAMKRGFVINFRRKLGVWKVDIWKEMNWVK
ncbi:hypothetical protein H0H92_012637 [Tricholoma furcatifolium]|nr:hypothetical protein H0H92_012637 [Tricholoma furcatifolium]